MQFAHSNCRRDLGFGVVLPCICKSVVPLLVLAAGIGPMNAFRRRRLSRDCPLVEPKI